MQTRLSSPTGQPSHSNMHAHLLATSACCALCCFRHVTCKLLSSPQKASLQQTPRLALRVLLCAHRSRELSELRAHLAEEKGTLEAVKKEVNSTDQRTHKQVGVPRLSLCAHVLEQPGDYGYICSSGPLSAS